MRPARRRGLPSPTPTAPTHGAPDSARAPATYADSDSAAVGGPTQAGTLPDLQTVLQYIFAVQELLDWAPTALVPVRGSISGLKRKRHRLG